LVKERISKRIEKIIENPEFGNLQDMVSKENGGCE
jgi:hypothetical protein